jgi:hypothetical protein
MIQRWINEELMTNQKIEWNRLGEVSNFSWQHNNAQTIQRLNKLPFQATLQNCFERFQCTQCDLKLSISTLDRGWHC